MQNLIHFYQPPLETTLLNKHTQLGDPHFAFWEHLFMFMVVFKACTSLSRRHHTVKAPLCYPLGTKEVLKLSVGRALPGFCCGHLTLNFSERNYNVWRQLRWLLLSQVYLGLYLRNIALEDHNTHIHFPSNSPFTTATWTWITGKKPQTKQQTQEKATSKKSTYLFWKQSQTKNLLSLTLQIKDRHLCWPPPCLASHFPLYLGLARGRHTSASEAQSFSRSFPKANQSHPAQIPTTNASPAFAGLPVEQELFSWYREVGRQGAQARERKKEHTWKWTVPSVLYAGLSVKMSFWNTVLLQFHSLGSSPVWPQN